MSRSPIAEPLRARLQRALPAAMKARDRAAVAALRSALAAIDNAEAVDPPPAPGAGGDAVIAGAVRGLGAGEADPRELTESQIAEIVRAEISDRRAAATAYERAGQVEEADRLQAEAAVLTSHLDGA